MSAVTPEHARPRSLADEIAREGLVPVRYPRASAGGVAANVALGLFGALFATPLLWMVLSSVDAHASWSVHLPSLTVGNYSALMHETTLRPLWNSMYLAGLSTVVTTVLAVLSAYVLSRRHVPLKRTFLFFILFASGLPVTMVIVPTYELFTSLDWLNSQFWTSMFLAASSLPFAIWLMKNFIDAVPEELEESAGLEGASSLRILLRIIVPLTMPGIGVTAIVTFINGWGAFLVPFVLNSDAANTPGSIAVYNFLSAFTTPKFGQLAAYSLLFSVPVLVLYLAMARRLAGAFSFGGSLKG
jgi:multiple sugar transport system permease protein